MTVRALELLDLPILYRCRTQSVLLYSADKILAERPFNARTLLPPLANKTRLAGIATSTPPLIGSLYKIPNTRLAALHTLTPRQACQSENLSALLNWLTQQAEAWRRPFLRAELPADDELDALLLMNGFLSWTWQQHYICIDNLHGAKNLWRPAAYQDELDIQRLYRRNTPDPLRWAEAPESFSPGWVYPSQGPLEAYARVLHGRHGQIIYPLCDPDLNAPRQVWGSLLSRLRPQGTPLYLRLRAPQIWLASALADYCQPYGSREKVYFKPLGGLVKPHLSHTQPREKSFALPLSPLTNDKP